jgi:hypothetical protein
MQGGLVAPPVCKGGTKPSLLFLSFACGAVLHDRKGISIGGVMSVDWLGGSCDPPDVRGEQSIGCLLCEVWILGSSLLCMDAEKMLGPFGSEK